MDMTTASELLIHGEPERAGHLLVADMAGQLGGNRNRRGGQRRDPGSRLCGGAGGLRPAPAHLPAKVIEPLARLGIGFHLLQLQLEIQRLPTAVARPAGAVLSARASTSLRRRRQHRASHRPRLPGLGLDQQKLFFDTHRANGHGLALPPDHLSTPSHTEQNPGGLAAETEPAGSTGLALHGVEGPGWPLRQQ